MHLEVGDTDSVGLREAIKQVFGAREQIILAVVLRRLARYRTFIRVAGPLCDSG